MPEEEEDGTIELTAAPSNGSRGFWMPTVETIVATVIVGAILFELSSRELKFETNSILLALLPVLFWLLASGKLSSFKAFGV
jgi:hypothetical protein